MHKEWVDEVDRGRWRGQHDPEDRQCGVGEGEVVWTILGLGSQVEEFRLCFPVFHQGGAGVENVLEEARQEAAETV